jgi:hypothetical protein
MIGPLAVKLECARQESLQFELHCGTKLSGNADTSLQNYSKMDSSRIGGTVAAIRSTRKQPRLQFQDQHSLKSGGNVDTWLRKERTLTALCESRIKFESNEHI